MAAAGGKSVSGPIEPVGTVRTAPIAVADGVLDDLRERLWRTRWPTAIPDGGWEAGTPVEAVRELCEYWSDGYDWRAQERRINASNPSSCRIDGVELHFLHLRGGSPAAVPLLLLHGWPSSQLEFLPLAELLMEGGREPAFDLVIPSLPGFGFGGKPKVGGWGISRIAAAFQRLMTEALGYHRFGVQGGDWGALVASKMAADHPSSLCGIHLSTVLSRLQLDPGVLRSARTPRERAAAEVRERFEREEIGYAIAQGTRPLSLAFAQTDSPAGLLAWILEKLRAWSDCDGEVERHLGRDFILGTAMYYWAPESVASSARLYLEAARDRAGLVYPRITVPTAVAALPRDVLPAVRRWAEAVYPIERWTDFPAGGHFAAVEQPALLAEELRAFFGVG